MFHYHQTSFSVNKGIARKVLTIDDRIDLEFYIDLLNKMSG
jgi:hypothetical protein